MQYIFWNLPKKYSGLQKLYRILWFSETEAMFRTRKPLTGHQFIRQQYGPVPLNAHLMRDDLVNDGILEELKPEATPDGGTRRPFRAKEAVTIKNCFTPEQIEIVNEQIAKYKKTAEWDVSDIYKDSVWLSLEDADVMPLELYISRPGYDEE